jgi:hypothetical protein
VNSPINASVIGGGFLKYNQSTATLNIVNPAMENQLRLNENYSTLIA